MKDMIANLVSQGIELAINKLKEFATEAINVGMDFDSAMSKVKATSSASAEDMELLRDKAKEMGSETKFSATESAEALNFMAMAGWKTNEMLEGIEGVMDLAAASGEELATTSDIVTDALTALSMSAEESGHFADVLASASSNANTNVSLMGESFKYVAPVAGAMGSSAEDLAIALGLMANSGIKGSQSGNALKNSLVNLIRPTAQQAQAMSNLGLATIKTRQVFDDDTIAKAQTKVENKTLDLEKAQLKYNDAINRYGVESSQAQTALINIEKAENNLADAERDLATARQGTIEVLGIGESKFADEQGNMKSLAEIMKILRDTFETTNVELTDSEGNLRDYDDIINELSQSEDNLTQVEQLKNASIVFGKQNLAGMLAIINASEEDYNKLSDAIYNCDGKAKEMADTMSDNLGGDMTKFQSQLESLKIAFYEKFVDSLREGVKSLGKLIDAGYWILDHGTEISAVIAGIAAAFVAFKAVTFIQSAITAFQTLATVIQAVGVKQAILNAIMAANPVGLIVAAIAGLVAAFVVLWNKSEAFRNFWIGLWEIIKTVALAAWETIKEKFSKLGDFFSNLWNSLKQIFQNGIDIVVKIFSGAVEKIKTVWSTIKSFFVGIWESIKSVFSAVGQWIYNYVFVPVMNFFQPVIDFFATAFEIIGQLAVGCWEAIKAVWEVVSEWFNENIFEPLTEFFIETWVTVTNAAQTAWEFIKGIWEVVSSWFNENIIQPLTELFTEVWGNITSAAQTAWEFVKSIWETVSDWFNENIIMPVSDFFTGMWESLVTGATLAWEGIKTVFSVIVEWFGTKFTEAWTAVKAVFSTGGQIFDGIKEGITSAFKTVVNAIIRGINKVIAIPFNAINNTLDRIRNINIAGAEPFSGLISRFDVPKIPELREGGVLKKGQVGFLEGDGDEAVVPLERNTRWIDEVSARISRNIGVSNQYSSNTENHSVTNNFYQTNNSPKALSRLEIYRQSRNLLKTLG